MESTTQRISPLCRRMIDDMRMRKLSYKTQRHYIRAVRQFAVFLGRSPDTASVEDLRRYQLDLVDQGVSPISLNAAITGLKFFFEVVFQAMRPLKPDDVARGQYAGYRKEPGVAKHSDVETFCALRLFIGSWRWEGVPWYLRSGKCLAETAAEVIVQLKPPPQRLFADSARPLLI